MKCPECVESGETSKVYDRGQTRTLMGGGGRFWDEDGELHSHDPNIVTSGFQCSNGHMWATKRKISCLNPACDYGREEV